NQVGCAGTLENTVIIEPVSIAAGATVRGSIIGPNVSVAAGCVIEASIIKDSIVNADCRVQSMTLAESILGDSVQLIGSPRRMNIGDHSLIEMQ
ncbi:MAG: nucleotidyltransferase, partial [Desulfuromonas sp.]